MLTQLWTTLAGDPELLARVETSGPEQVLPGSFDVTELAASTVAAATLAVAELGAERRSAAVPQVEVDRLAASAAFRSEALQRPLGWELPQPWDPIAGNYRTAAEGWIRLHTNYAYHRTAALHALGLDPRDDVDRDRVAARVLDFEAAELEQLVVAEGGCAAALYTGAEWAVHPQGRHALDQPAVELRHPASSSGLSSAVAQPPDIRPPRGDSPLAGVRVLDLTRVIAGPVATRTLAAWGADVLRIDPPGFIEVAALLPDMTTGKRCAALDLRDDGDRARFSELVAEADVIVHGLRPGALTGLGYTDDVLRRINPGLCIAALDAYGWAGPWAGRRGFDSLVQLSCGIAVTSAAAIGSDLPGALPAQALDHGAGYLLAAGVCRGLTGTARGLGPADVRASLIGIANLLTGQPASPSFPIRAGVPAALGSVAVRRDTGWGPMMAIGQPGSIGGRAGTWQIPSGPLGRDAAKFGPGG